MYGYQIANIVQTVLILSWHIDPTLVDICARIQPTTASNSHVTAIYVPETNVAMEP